MLQIYFCGASSVIYVTVTVISKYISDRSGETTFPPIGHHASSPDPRRQVDHWSTLQRGPGHGQGVPKGHLHGRVDGRAGILHGNTRPLPGYLPGVPSVEAEDRTALLLVTMTSAPADGQELDRFVAWLPSFSARPPAWPSQPAAAATQWNPGCCCCFIGCSSSIRGVSSRAFCANLVYPRKWFRRAR